MKQSSIARISLWSLWGRIISELTLRLFFPIIFIDKNQSLEKAAHDVKKGKGLIIIFNHFSLRDAMEVNRSIIFKHPILRIRRAVNPLAYYQYNKPMEMMSKFYSADFSPIVNNSTLTKKGYEHLPRGQGLREFITASNNVLSKGGIVTLAVNATRKEKLDLSDPQKPVGYFIASLQAQGMQDYGLILVGFTVKNAKSYSKKEVGGMNMGKTYIMNIGKYYTLKELLAKSDIGGKISNVDAFIRKEMAKIVAKEYLQEET